MDFDNNAERTWWFYDQLGPAARNQIDTAFSENGELAKRFSMIERDKLALVLKEQGLATSGAVDPQSAAKVVGCRIERHIANEHLVEDHAKGVDVGAAVHLLSNGLFGRHVMRRAERIRRPRELRRRTFLEGLRDSEVEPTPSPPPPRSYPPSPVARYTAPMPPRPITPSMRLSRPARCQQSDSPAGSWETSTIPSTAQIDTCGG